MMVQNTTNNWVQTSLEQLIDIKHGWAFPGAGITETASNNVLVTPGNFKIGGGFKNSNKKFFEGDYPEEYLLSPGDLIVTMTDLSKGADTLGYSALVPNDGRNYLHNQRIGLVRIKSDKIRKDYLYWLMRTYHYQRFIAGSASGTTVKHTSPSSIKKYRFPLPPKKEQEEIARILSSLDDKIELNNLINRNLEEQAFSFYNNLVNEAKQQCELNSIAVLNPARSLQKGTIAQCIDMAQLSTTSAYPNPGVYKSYGGGMKFQNGDTLLARITPCLENGKTAYIDFLKEGEIAFGSTEYIVLSSRGEMPPQFFYCLARDKRFRDYAIKHMNGSSGRQRVSADALAKYMIPSISKEDMRLFGQNVEPLFKLIRQKADENIRLSSLRDTLLPKLMSGEMNLS